MDDRKRKGKEREKERAKDPPETVTAQLVLDKHRPFCAPLQQLPSDIPVLHFNLGADNFLAEYIRVIMAIITRAKAISPAILLNKAITPMGNPCNNPKPYSEKFWENLGNSHFIIEMRHTEDIDGKLVKRYKGMKVRILFCDYNGYQIAFCRYLNKKWSSWYYCSKKDFPLPFFLKDETAIKLPLNGDYIIKPRIGGQDTFHNIFRTFGHYPEKQNHTELTKDFLASAVVLCEARRIYWIFLETQERIRLNQAPRELDCNLPGKERTKEVAWAEIGDWSSDCEVALIAVRDGEFKAHTAARGYAQRSRPVIQKFGQLLAEDEESGHLCLLMRVEGILAPKDGWVQKRLRKDGLKIGAKVAEPMFPGDEDPELHEGDIPDE